MSAKTDAEQLIDEYTKGTRSIDEVLEGVTVKDAMTFRDALLRLILPTAIRVKRDEKEQDRFWREDATTRRVLPR